MNELTAVVIGASGLTGNLVVEELVKDTSFKAVRLLVRKPLTFIHPKIEQQIVDFNNFKDYDRKFGDGDVIFCCIGTTQKKVKGDKVEYEKIDHDIPVNAAKIGVAHHFKKFLIVSAVGANENSSNFYLNLKGKTENSLKKFSFESLSIFQPSLLNGNRKENRMGETIAQSLMDILSFLLLGPLQKYKAIGANNVARAMVYESKKQKTGTHYYQYPEMMDMTRELINDREIDQSMIKKNQYSK